MSVLLADTHLLVWAVSDPAKLSEDARQRFLGAETTVLFSVASLWELVIKRSTNPERVATDPIELRRTLLADGFTELSITADHVLAVADLPPIHRDPFDRLLLAQAIVEGATLITADRLLASYPGPVEFAG